MMEQPLFIAHIFSYGLKLLFYTTVFLFVLNTAFLAYHWFAYGTSRSLSMLSLAILLIGAAPLFIIMAITL